MADLQQQHPNHTKPAFEISKDSSNLPVRSDRDSENRTPNKAEMHTQPTEVVGTVQL